MGDQQQRRKLRAASESPKLTQTTPPRVPRRSQRVAPGPLVFSGSTSPTVPEPPSRESAIPEIVAAAGVRGPSSSLSPVGTASAGDGGATHAAPVTAEVASGTPQQSRPRQFPWFSRRPDGVASRSPFVFPRRRLNVVDRERTTSFRLPLFRRRCSGGEAGTGAAAAAGGSAAGGETTRVRQPRNSKERWRRALRKLRLKRR